MSANLIYIALQKALRSIIGSRPVFEIDVHIFLRNLTRIYFFLIFDLFKSLSQVLQVAHAYFIHN